MRRVERKKEKIASTQREGMLSRMVAVWIGLLCLAVCPALLTGKEVDRLLVAVNGTVITEGDLYIARTLNPLVFSGGNIDPVSRKAEIDSLVDLELIRQELENFSVDSENAGDLDARAEGLRNRLGETGSFVRLLEHLGLRESELMSYLKFQISILDFVAYRFRPFSGVTKAEIQDYYEDTYLPQLRETGLDAPSLIQVSSRIEEILKAEKINEALDQWLQDARRSARIEYFDVDVPAKEESENSLERLKSGIKE